MKIEIFPDSEALGKAAAEFFIRIANKAISEKGKFAVAFSGGNTPRLMYQYLARPEQLARTPWENVYIFWGDERCVGYNDTANNAHNAFDQLLDKVPASADHIFRIESELPPDTAAEKYEKVLRRFFGDNPPRFDMIFLGLGENGHTASLFPGTAILKETEKWVSPVYVEEQNMHRITLTPVIINQAANIVFLVTGTNKASVLKEILEGEYEPDNLPAQLINPDHGVMHWFIDKDAARLLTKANA